MTAISGHARNAFRASLPVLREAVYLDNAGVSPLSTRIQERIVESLSLRARRGKMGLKQVMPAAVLALKTGAAALLSASPEEIAVVQNTTMGMTMIAQGMSWQAGDVVLIPEGEFPANVYPWLALAPRGVSIRRLPTRNGAFSAADVAGHIDARTRVLALSHVGYCSGFRADLEGIGRACKRRGVLFVVDAAQSLGAHPIDVRAFGIDALAASGWKWLMGPIGIGLLHCSAELAERLSPPLVGAGSVTGGESVPASWPFDFHPGAARFEYSSIDPSAICGLAAAVETIRAFGAAAIEADVLALTSSLRQRLRSRGWSPFCDAEGPDATSGILSVRREGVASDRLLPELHRRGVHCGHWHGHLRLSPHFYNTELDLEKLLSNLPS